MGLGDLTKQLAKQAIGNPVKDVVDSLSGNEAVPEKAAAPDLAALILGQLHAMQKPLKEDEELAVFFTSGGETIRVFDIFVPSPQAVVLTGIDSDKNQVRVITPVSALQLVCKPRPVAAPAKPARVRIVAPKPKPE
jgi:hypothetical protein